MAIITHDGISSQGIFQEFFDYLALKPHCTKILTRHARHGYDPEISVDKYACWVYCQLTGYIQTKGEIEKAAPMSSNVRGLFHQNK
jgi:hypothetical protein